MKVLSHAIMSGLSEEAGASGVGNLQAKESYPAGGLDSGIQNAFGTCMAVGLRRTAFALVSLAAGLCACQVVAATTQGPTALDRRPAILDPIDANSEVGRLRRDAQARRTLIESSTGPATTLLVNAISPSTGKAGIDLDAQERSSAERLGTGVIAYLRTVPPLAQPRDFWPEITVSVYGDPPQFPGSVYVHRPREVVLGLQIDIALWHKSRIWFNSEGRWSTAGGTAVAMIQANGPNLDQFLMPNPWRDEIGHIGFARPTSDEFAPLMLFRSGDGVLLPSGVPLFSPVSMERALRLALAIAKVQKSATDEVLLAQQLKPSAEHHQEVLARFDVISKQLATLDARTASQQACVRTPGGAPVRPPHVRIVPVTAGDCEPMVSINPDLLRRPAAADARMATRYVLVRTNVCSELRADRPMPDPQSLCRKFTDLTRAIDWNRMRTLMELRRP